MDDHAALLDVLIDRDEGGDMQLVLRLTVELVLCRLCLPHRAGLRDIPPLAADRLQHTRAFQMLAPGSSVK